MITQSERNRIVDTIREAEARTAGEIFCVMTGRSSEYHHHSVIWAAAIALFLPVPMIAFTRWSASVDYLLQISSFVITAIALSHPGLRLHIVPKVAQRHRAHAEAIRLFSVQGLHNSEQRTGVLIFASIAERYAEIVADASIADKVGKHIWDDAVNSLISAMKTGRPADGFVAAIEKCGAVLATHFPPGSLESDRFSNRFLEI